MVTNGKVWKIVQTIREINKNVSLVEPMTTKLFLLINLTETPENPLREHLVSVCQFIDPVFPEIKWGNLRASIVVIYNGH